MRCIVDTKMRKFELRAYYYYYSTGLTVAGGGLVRGT